MKMQPKFPYYPMIGEVYEARSIKEAAKKINEEGFVMILIHEEAEANGQHLFCLGKIDPSRATHQ